MQARFEAVRQAGRSTSRDSSPTAVIHVTEAFGGGVYQIVVSIARQQAANGVNVTVIASRRADTPPLGVVRRDLGDSVSYVEVSGLGLRSQLSNLVTTARVALRTNPDSFVHLHSSWAGAALRLRFGWGRRRSHLVYSPHGFAFLRQDISVIRRWFFRVGETFLARLCAGLIVASKSEADLARDQLRVGRCALVENTVDISELPALAQGESGSPLRVVTAGRVVYQKAPWRFATLARELQGLAEFEWLGDGDEDKKSKWFGPDSDITVSGWLDHGELLKRLATADLFVMTSLWEGMPVALIEAQCMGLPAVVTNCVGNRDVVLDTSSGYVVATDEELAQKVRDLLGHADLRVTMSVNALKQRLRFSKHDFAKRISDAYLELALPVE